MAENQKTEESAESGVLLKVLVNKVANMRDLQKKYFKTRDSQVLKEAKQAEQDVDRVVEQIKKPNLF
ncbi:hypothetical protein D3C87_1376210 [compost metagenome]